MIAYSITNKLNNKKYFCLTGYNSLKQAKYYHRQKAKCIMPKMELKPTSRKGKSPFHKAYARYGETNFRYRIEDRFSNRTDAFAYKERLIAKYNTMNPDYGYNCNTGGNRSFNHAPHVKERQSVAQTGKIMPESWIVFMTEKIKNHPETYPHFQKGYICTEEEREKLRQGQLNSDYVQTEEVQIKKSVSMKKRWQEPEIIAKMAKRERGVVTDETRRKLSKRSSGKNNGMYGKPAWNRGIPIPQWQKDIISKKNKEHHRIKREKLLKEYSKKTEKKCYKCEEVKNLNMFYKSKAHLDGYAGLCKLCEKKKKLDFPVWT